MPLCHPQALCPFWPEFELLTTVGCAGIYSLYDMHDIWYVEVYKFICKYKSTELCIRVISSTPTLFHLLLFMQSKAEVFLLLAPTLTGTLCAYTHLCSLACLCSMHVHSSTLLHPPPYMCAYPLLCAYPHTLAFALYKFTDLRSYAPTSALSSYTPALIHPLLYHILYTMRPLY